MATPPVTLDAVQGFSMVGGVRVVTQGVSSTTRVQGSYPQCRVRVYASGTTGLSPIFDALGNPLPNPFTANTDGSWLFHAGNGVPIDVVMDGGVPIAMPQPFTLTGIIPGGRVSASGGAAGTENEVQTNIGGFLGAAYSTFVGSDANIPGNLTVVTDIRAHQLLTTGSATPAQPNTTYLGHAGSLNQARVMATGPDTVTVGGVRLDGESSDYSLSINYLSCTPTGCTMPLPLTVSNAVNAAWFQATRSNIAISPPSSVQLGYDPPVTAGLMDATGPDTSTYGGIYLTGWLSDHSQSINYLICTPAGCSFAGNVAVTGNLAVTGNITQGGGGGGGFVALTPTGTQNIIQPPNTNFTVSTSGTGGVAVNGTLQSTLNITSGTFLSSNSGELFLRATPTSGTAEIAIGIDNALHISGASGGILLNWENGSGGIGFGNGAGTGVGSLDNAGNFSVSGEITGSIVRATHVNALAEPSTAVLGYAHGLDQARLMGVGSSPTDIGGVRLDGESSDYSVGLNYLSCTPTGCTMPLPFTVLGNVTIDNGELDVAGDVSTQSDIVAHRHLVAISPTQPLASAQIYFTDTAGAAEYSGTGPDSSTVSDLLLTGKSSDRSLSVNYLICTPAGSSFLTSLTVEGSPVRTFANTPDGGGTGGMVWPDVGVAVSAGDHWESPSIDPTTLARTNNVLPLTLTAPTTVAMGTNNLTIAGSAAGNTGGTIYLGASTPANAVTIRPGNAGSTLQWRYAFYSAGTDLNNLQSTYGSGDFVADANAPNAPPQLATQTFVGLFTHTNNSGTYSFQTAWNINDPVLVSRVFIRRRSSVSNLWTPWVELLHDDGAGSVAVTGNLSLGGHVQMTGVFNSPVITGAALDFSGGYARVLGLNASGASPSGVQLVGVNNTGVGTTYLQCSSVSGLYTPFPLDAVGNITTTANNQDFPFIAAAQGTTLGWNSSGNGQGESDFINNSAGAPGGFNWYTAAPGTRVDSTIPTIMHLTSVGALSMSSLGVGLRVGTGSLPQASIDGLGPRTFRFVSLAGDSTVNAGGYTLVGYSSNYSRTNNYISCYDDGTAFHTDVAGVFTVNGTKNFQITHPLDDSKNLIHACLEGPEAAVFYRGEATTDHGIVEITLPDYFEALTRPEGRTVLVTPLFETEDESFSRLAASRIKDGKFRVRSLTGAQQFYWEVKAVRADVEPLRVVTDISEPASPEKVQ